MTIQRCVGRGCESSANITVWRWARTTSCCRWTSRAGVRSVGIRRWRVRVDGAVRPVWSICWSGATVERSSYWHRARSQLRTIRCWCGCQRLLQRRLSTIEGGRWSCPRYLITPLHHRRFIGTSPVPTRMARETQERRARARTQPRPLPPMSRTLWFTITDREKLVAGAWVEAGRQRRKQFLFGGRPRTVTRRRVPLYSIMRVARWRTTRVTAAERTFNFRIKLWSRIRTFWRAGSVAKSQGIQMPLTLVQSSTTPSEHRGSGRAI